MDFLTAMGLEPSFYKVSCNIARILLFSCKESKSFKSNLMRKCRCLGLDVWFFTCKQALNLGFMRKMISPGVSPEVLPRMARKSARIDRFHMKNSWGKILSSFSEFLETGNPSTGIWCGSVAFQVWMRGFLRTNKPSTLDYMVFYKQIEPSTSIWCGNVVV